jgi:hypothetical protein
MEEIWIIGLGHFGNIAFTRLSETLKDSHFVLVDPVEKNLLKCKGPAATLRVSDGVKFLERYLKGPQTGLDYTGAARSSGGRVDSVASGNG